MSYEPLSHGYALFDSVDDIRREFRDRGVGGFIRALVSQDRGSESRNREPETHGPRHDRVGYRRRLYDPGPELRALKRRSYYFGAKGSYVQSVVVARRN